ncbi:Rha family transcriptional regulator [Escherichia coli]|nr:Rha family transcriptional regulator [Escherichia coli]EIZ3924297.1 Rha family transcriptional regulator [Escherichia coli]
MNLSISQKATMTSIEIAELVGKRHDNVKRTIEVLTKGGVIQFPQIEEIENKQSVGPRRFSKAYIFEGEQGKRDSIIVVAQLSPEFTARLVDRWRELEEQVRQPLTEIEMIAAMAANAVQQQKRLHVVESKVSQVVETVEQIKKGNMPEGYIGYRQLAAKCGLTEAKCRNLVNAYRIPTDTHEFLTPEGVLSRRSIVALSPFMNAFNRMMSEAEHRGKRWYHPKMGQFQVIGWGGE